jgi:hypothetical protein
LRSKNLMIVFGAGFSVFYLCTARPATIATGGHPEGGTVDAIRGGSGADEPS